LESSRGFMIESQIVELVGCVLAPLAAPEPAASSLRIVEESCDGSPKVERASGPGNVVH